MYKSLFDDYVWKSRILVGILVCLPVILITPWTLKLLVPEANPWISNPVVVAAILAVISAVVRRLGLIAEKALLEEWGGYPSTAIMRWSDGHKSDEWKRHFHLLVKDKLHISLTSPEEEENNPKAADTKITDAFGAVRTKIWGKKESSSHSATTNYGFARNLYGCRWLWLGISILSLGFIVGVPFLKGMPFVITETAACALLAIAIPIVEWFIIKPLVWHCAYQYAEHAWESVA